MPIDRTKPPARYIMYLRKSSEDPERQIASLPSQKKELDELVMKEKLKVIQVYEESQSAHKRGRPLFNKMVEQIENGEADGILVWHLNRIARNAADGGLVIDLMDQNKLLSIRTPSMVVTGDGNDKFILQIEFAMSKKYSDDLSFVVRRGNRQKFFERKEWVGLAKPGYLNVKNVVTGENTIAIDEARFKLLQQAMKLVISGEYSVSEVYHKLVDEWHYRTRQKKNSGNCKLHKSAFYRILYDPFYYGLMVRKEGTVMGNHTPMLTKHEFHTLQARIGKWNKNKSEINLPYRGLLKCGECGSSIVAQEKWQITCPQCKTKFHRGDKTNCPKCDIRIEDMKNAKLSHYVYYGCTRKKNPNCTQKGHVEIKDIDKQIEDELIQYEIPEDFKNWGIKYLNEIHTNESFRQRIVTDNLTKRLARVKDELNQLLKTKISPDNVKGQLVTEEEYLSQRSDLIQERESLEDQIQNSDKLQDQYLELTEKTFDFVCYAKYWFEQGDSKEKSLILKSLGYNLTILDKKLRFTAPKPFFLIRKAFDDIKHEVEKLEPEKRIDNPINYGSVERASSIMSGW